MECVDFVKRIRKHYLILIVGVKTSKNGFEEVSRKRGSHQACGLFMRGRNGGGCDISLNATPPQQVTRPLQLSTMTNGMNAVPMITEPSHP